MENNKINNQPEKILIYSGAFNPVHLGHIEIVLNTISEIHFNKIIINIDKHSPWKPVGELIPYSFRKEMFVNLVGDKFKYVINENNQNLSYAYDIVTDIKTKYPKASLYYLVGEDQYKLLKKWERYSDIDQLVTFICHCRSDHNKIRKISNKHIILYHKYIACDSASLRQSLSAKYLGQQNCVYIKKHHFYLQYQITDMLTNHRYQHTLRVLDTITKIAYANHFSEQEVANAQIAAILHDITKSWDDRQYLKIFPLSFLKTFPSYHCAHGYAAAEIAQKKFKIHNKTILDAVRNHVIYKDELDNKIAKALYCADKLEPARLPTDIANREALLAQCCQDLKNGFANVLKATVEKYK